MMMKPRRRAWVAVVRVATVPRARTTRRQPVVMATTPRRIWGATSMTLSCD